MRRALLRDRRAWVIAGLPGILRAWTVWSHGRMPGCRGTKPAKPILHIFGERL